MNKIVYAFCTYRPDEEMAVANVEKVSDYVDSVIVLEDGTLSKSARGIMLAVGANIITRPWDDNWSAIYNYWLDAVKKIDPKAWVLNTDADEDHNGHFLGELRTICKDAERDGYNNILINTRDYTPPVGIREIDDAAWAPVPKPADYLKPLTLYHINLGVKFYHHGPADIPVHTALHHGRWGLWNSKRLPEDFYFTHVKTMPKWWENRTRDLFTCGGGINLGATNPKWVKLRKICDRLDIKAWHEFNDYLIKGDVNRELAEFIQSLRLDNFTEHHEFFNYYYVWLHRDEWEAIGKPMPITLELRFDTQKHQAE